MSAVLNQFLIKKQIQKHPKNQFTRPWEKMSLKHLVLGCALEPKRQRPHYHLNPLTWVMRKTYIHIKTKKKKSVPEATPENHKTNVNIPKGHRPPPNPQPAHPRPTNAHSQTGPLVPNVTRNARNHGEGTAHAWRLASAPPGTQTVLVFRPSKNQTVLVFRPSKNQAVWFFTPPKTK